MGVGQGLLLRQWTATLASLTKPALSPRWLGVIVLLLALLVIGLLIRGRRSCSVQVLERPVGLDILKADTAERNAASAVVMTVLSPNVLH